MWNGIRDFLCICDALVTFLKIGTTSQQSLSQRSFFGLEKTVIGAAWEFSPVRMIVAFYVSSLLLKELNRGLDVRMSGNQEDT